MPETTPLIKAALNLRVGAGFDVYIQVMDMAPKKKLKNMRLMVRYGMRLF